MNAALIGGPMDGLIIPLRRGSSQLFIRFGTGWTLYERDNYGGDGSISMITIANSYRCTSGVGDDYLYRRVLSRNEVNEAKRRAN